jgi:ATP-dependent protease ClpP protease subunit
MNVAKVEIFGGIGDGQKDLNGRSVTLFDVEKQLKEQQPFSAIHVQICSPGGYLEVADSIIERLLMFNVPITTEAFGVCSSAATIIFLMGQKRIIHPRTPFLVHPPSGALKGTPAQIESQLKEMKAVEQRVLNLYMGRNDKNPKTENQWRKLLNAEKTFVGEELIEIGFATELYKPIYSMNSTKKLSGFELIKHKTYRVLGIKLSMLDLQTSDGTILIVQTSEATPKVGDAVVTNETGEAAQDGTYQVSMNGVPYMVVVSQGVIAEIKSEEEMKAPPAKEEEMTAVLEAVATATAEMKAKYETEMNALKQQLKERDEFCQDISKKLEMATGEKTKFTMGADRGTEKKTSLQMTPEQAEKMLIGKIK